MSTFKTSTNWLTKAKIQLKECTEKRLYDRMNKIEQVINSILPSHITSFSIDESLKQQICRQVSNEIDKYEGTKKLKSNLENSLDDVIKKTRTWWNRTKSHKLGSILFTPICFYILHNFIKQQCRGYSYPEQIKLFIDIFIAFMEDTIKFPKTKPKSLIPHQCLLAQSEFRDICSEFVKTFGDENIKCDFYIKKVGPKLKNGKKIYEYIKEKNRSSNLFNGFKQCLEQIKEKISKEFDNELIQKWDDIIHKFRPKDYQLSFRCITPVNYNNISRNIRKINAYNCHCNNCGNNCDNIPENNIIVPENNVIIPQNNFIIPENNINGNSNNYCCDYEYNQCVQYDTNMKYNNQFVQPPVSYTPYTPYKLHVEPETLCNSHIQYNNNNNNTYTLPQYEQERYNHREFQSTNEYCAPVNRIHRADYIYGNDHINSVGNINTSSELRIKRREQHIEELMNNTFNSNTFHSNMNYDICDSSQYLSNDSNTNTVSEVASITDASNGSLFCAIPSHLSDNANIVSNINEMEMGNTFMNDISSNDCYNKCFFDDTIIPPPFEEDNFVNHII